MKKDLRLIVVGGALVLALCVSALASQTAFADDGTPPPDSVPSEPVVDSPATEAPPEPDAAPTEAVPTEAAPTEVAPVETPTADEAPASDPAATDVLDALPEGTDLVVLDETGSTVPLVTEEAATIVSTGDPVWCPVGVAPSNGGGGCSPSFTRFVDDVLSPTPSSIDSLLEWLDDPLNSKSVAGVIWVMQDSTPDNQPIVLNGLDYGTTANFALTINGGWNGTFGSTGVVQTHPSTFNVSFSVTNWVGDVTLNDIVVTGAAGDGLTVSTDGKATLNRVKAVNNSGDGIHVTAKGAITLTSVIATGNGGEGAYLDNLLSPTALGVTLTGLNLWNPTYQSYDNTFSNNVLTGLEVQTKGLVTFSNLTASINGHLDSGTYYGYGALINNTGGTTAGVTATGVNVFNGNFIGGLNLTSNGAVTLSSVMANSNQQGYGTFIDNSTALPLTQNVTLSGTNVFKYNYNTNLYIQTKGIITVNNVTANGSETGDGAWLDNSFSLPAAPRAVVMTGFNFFNDNGLSGLEVLSYGALTLANITANNNGDFGARLDYINNAASVQNVTLSGLNTFNNNIGTGLRVSSFGTITISSLTAKDNGGFGVTLHNNVNGTTIPRGIGNVNLTGTNVFQNNFNAGLDVQSFGSISASNLQASGNGVSTYSGVFLLNSDATGTPGVTVSGTNNISDNKFDGLVVQSKGAISVSNLTASRNGTANNASGGYGAVLNNAAGTVSALSGGVTVSGIGVFNDNFLTGLTVDSYGAISLTMTSMSAKGNGVDSHNGWGALLDNSGAFVPKNVALAGTNNFSGNYDGGLSILSKGAISTSNVTANDNVVGSGAVLNNLASTASGVTMAGVNTFNGNYLDGLNVQSKGLITAAGLNATGNGEIASGSTYGYGVRLDNTAALLNSLSPGVTLTGVDAFVDNYLTGLHITTYGTVALSTTKMTATGNGVGSSSGWGVYVDNSSAFVPKNVALAGTNNFSGNYDGGLSILSKGAISTSSVTANDNVVGSGAVLNNLASTASGVTMAGVNTFNGNYLDGLNVQSKGLITAAGLNATGNGEIGSGSTYGYGVRLDNTAALLDRLSPGVTLTGVDAFVDNYLTGLQVTTYGTVALSTTKMTATGNGVGSNLGWGVYVDNSGAFVPKNVTLAGTNVFSGNHDGGLSVLSKGAISAVNVTAKDNTAGPGVILVNNGSGALGNVTLTGLNVFNGNYLTGLTVQSKGLITAAGLTATGNGTIGSGTADGYGVILDNTSALLNSLSPGVTLTGVTTFSGNYLTGLSVSTFGTVSFSTTSMTANDNGSGSGTGWGVLVDNSNAAVAKNVTLAGNNVFSGNDLGGLYVQSKGAITTNNVTASSNTSGTGAMLMTTGTGIAGNVKMTGTNVFRSNFGKGLFVTTLSSISINNLTASYNTGDNGARLYITGGTGTVTLTGTNSFIENGAAGLSISNNGNVSITKITADGNVGDGLYVSTTGLTATLTVTCGSFTNNQGDGLNWSASSALLSGVFASGNTGQQITGSPTMVARICTLP